MTVRAIDAARLITLAVIWSASFVLIRVLAPVIGPLWVATGRLLIGGVAVAAWLALLRTAVDLRGHWPAYVIVGVLNCALPFVLYGYAALHLPASYLVIVNAMTPLFSAAVGAVALAEPLTRRRIIGLTAGVGGVALVTRAVPVPGDASFALAVAAGLGAALCYALAAVWLKRRGGALAPMAIAAWSQLFAGGLLLPVALPSRVAGPVGAAMVIDLLLLGLVCSGLAYLLYYRLIRDIGPTRTLTVTFLMPAFGMGWGAWLLDESITAGMLAGAMLILGGTTAVLRPAPARTQSGAARNASA